MENFAEILEGCRKKDRQSQQKLYTRLYPPLYALCKKFFADPHEILSALNDGMLQVYKHIDQYDPARGEFFSWAYTIIRRSAITRFRRQRPSLTFELTENISGLQGTNPFKHLEWKDIYQALANLPSNTRCVCTLFYLEGFSIKEIAQSLDMKEGTVKWHLHESRTRLKTIFEDPKSIFRSA